MIIGFMGLAGVGKSTAGRILRDEYGFVPVSFADSLKDGVAALFNWPRNLLEGDTPESREFRETRDHYWSGVFNKDITPRWVLQFIGTQVFRHHVLEDFWVHAAMKRMQDKTKNYVVTDARFPNEFAMITGHSGFLVEVVNREPMWVQMIRGMKTREEVEAFTADMSVHASEWEHVFWRRSNPVDFVLYNIFDEIQNSTTMDNLSASITHMLRVFTGPKDKQPVKNQTLDIAF